jgi:xylan 1,4-beta-xylosidase
MHYTNPILPGFHPDPSVCRVGADFYLVTSTFEYFPGVPIYHSRDLVHWRRIGHCLTRDSQLPLEGAGASGGIFAPTLRYHEGRFYMVTTNTTRGSNFLVWTEDPAGEWSEPVWIPDGGIDPSLFWDDDGKVYFVSNGARAHRGKRGAFQYEIDLETGLAKSEAIHLWTGTGAQYPEAPHVFKKDGWYYLLMAEGGTEFGHMATIARSRNVNGPYDNCPHNPILTHRSMLTPLQSAGHGDLFEDAEGKWWIVFLACRHVGYPKMHHIGRETCLAPVTWDADGWPVVNGGEPVGLEIEFPRDLPELDASFTLDTDGRDDFDGPMLAGVWNFRRNPDAGSWSLSERPGWLSLRCIAASLADIAPTAFIGRRQQHLRCKATTLLDFAPQGEADEAGLTVLMSERYRCDLAVTRRNGVRVALLRHCVGSLTVETGQQPVAEGELTLEVQAEPEWYTFRLHSADGVTHEFGRVETRRLSTELAGGFTGVYIGMYATGNGNDHGGAGHFDWFEVSL